MRVKQLIEMLEEIENKDLEVWVQFIDDEGDLRIRMLQDCVSQEKRIGFNRDMNIVPTQRVLLHG